MLTLYEKDQCPFCWRVRMVLHRLGLAADRRPHDDSRWQAVWPPLTEYGSVPVLVTPTQVLTDSRVILEYLNDEHGGLLPLSAEGRAHAREVWCYADAGLGPAVRDLVFERRDHEPEDIDPAVIHDAAARWASAMPTLNNLLGDRHWFGETCGIADYVVVTRFGLAMAYDMPEPNLSTELASWIERIFARDEVVATAPRIVQQWLERQR